MGEPVETALYQEAIGSSSRREDLTSITVVGTGEIGGIVGEFLAKGGEKVRVVH